MTRVVFALERNAKTDPPDTSAAVTHWTECGPARYIGGSWRDWRLVTLDPQPSWWLDVRPSEGEPLKVQQMYIAVECVEAEAGWCRQSERPDHEAAEELEGIATRLRAALDAIIRKPAA